MSMKTMMRLNIVVKTNAKKNEVVFDESINAHRVSVKAKPVEGQANIVIVKFLGKHFKKKVSIVSGLRSNKKVIELK